LSTCNRIVVSVLMMTDIPLPLLWEQFVPEWVFSSTLKFLLEKRLFAPLEPGWSVRGRSTVGQSLRSSCRKRGESGGSCFSERSLRWQRILQWVDRFPTPCSAYVYINTHMRNVVYNPLELCHGGNVCTLITENWTDLLMYEENWPLMQLEVWD